MKHLVMLIAALWYGAAAALAESDIPLVPLPLEAENVEFTGTWNYSTSNHQVAGDCPNGTPMSGTLAITQSGGEIGVMFTSGAVCNPASMCMFSGAIKDGQLVVSNTAIVDDEGGSASNALRLFFYSASEGGGESASGYVHPKGFECQWKNMIDLWRSED